MSMVSFPYIRRDFVEWAILDILLQLVALNYLFHFVPEEATKNEKAAKKVANKIVEWVFKYGAEKQSIKAISPRIEHLTSVQDTADILF